jgi:hypothetical protein
MKIKLIILTVLSVLAGSVVAQEYDDMYFNKKDRAKLRESKVTEREVVLARNEKKDVSKEGTSEETNPTDSYSARNVNPEYTSRATSETAQSDNEDYFVNNYQYRPQAQYSNFNNNFNNWYNSPWYTTAYWGSGFNRWDSWNNPYYGGGYGSYYDNWGSPFGNPYYRSGWSSSFSFFMGNGWGSNWGMNQGWGTPYGYWGSSYSSFYNPYYSSYSPYYGGGGGWYGPTHLVVVERDRGYVYGKRSSRSGYIVTDANANNTGGRKYNNTGSGSRSDNGARVRATGTNQDDYYQRTSRNASRDQNTSGNSGNGTTNGRTSTSWGDDNNSRSTYRQTTTPSPTIHQAPARSSGWDNGNSRSSGSNNNSNSGSRSSRGRGN